MQIIDGAGVYTAASRYIVMGTVVMRAMLLAIAPQISGVLATGDRGRAQGLFETPLSAAEYFDLRRAPFFEEVGLYADYTATVQGELAERVAAG